MKGARKLKKKEPTALYIESRGRYEATIDLGRTRGAPYDAAAALLAMKRRRRVRQGRGSK